MLRKGAQQTCREFVQARTAGESPWKRLVGQCLLGEEPFLEKLSPYLKEKAALTEIPRVQRFAVRAPTGCLLPRARSRSKRNRAIAKAHLHFRYSQREIAAHVELHYSTVSRIVQRETKKVNIQGLTPGIVSFCPTLQGRVRVTSRVKKMVDGVTEGEVR